MIKITKNIIVLYHGACADGFSGAWAAWKKFGGRAQYLPLHHSDEPLLGLKNKEIYFVDIIYPPAAVKALIRQNKKVAAIDHHITAKSAVLSVPDHLFANNHSGSVLAWRYFHPKKPVPNLLKFVEDRDLYAWKLPKAREITAYLDLSPFDFNVWSRLAKDLERSRRRKEFIEKGKLILRYEKKLIGDIIIGNAELAEFAGCKTYAVNAPTIFATQIGEALLKKMPPLAIIWNKRKDRINVSLRAVGKVNAGKIAKKYGGGGHKGAAGFSFPAGRKFPWTPLEADRL